MLQTPLNRVGRRREKTRRVLLEVALGLFYEKGIYWTKIEDITERADIGKGTFYQYFETKEALLHALLQQGLEELLARMTAGIRLVKPGPKAVDGLIRGQLDFYLENPEYLLLFHQVRGLLQLKTQPAKDLREVYDAYLDRLAQIVRPALNGKGGHAKSARDIAVALSAYTSGLLTYSLLFGKAVDFKRRREAIQGHLERSIRALT